MLVVRSRVTFQKSLNFFCGAEGPALGLRSALITPESRSESQWITDFAGMTGSYVPGTLSRWNFWLGHDDIRYLPSRSLDRYVKEASDHPLLFTACAPCQPFSKLTKGNVNSGDKRFGLVGHVIRFIKRYRPEFLFVENVPGLSKSSLRRGAFELFVQRIQGLGYETEHRVVKSQEYGVPQRRSRLLLLASN